MRQQGVTYVVPDLRRSRRIERCRSAPSHASGINEPFPVQRLVVPDVLAGHDVLVKSPTGSGKTLAFGVPIVDRVEATEPAPVGARPRPHP